MADDPDPLRACIDRLAELVKLVQQVPLEDRARVERTIQLVTRALQTVVRTRQQTQNEARLRETTKIVALCQQIEELLWLEELRIKDDDSSR